MIKSKNDFLSSETAPKVYRTIKDRLFRYIFTRPDHKDWALNLFNSLEGTHYTNPDDLELMNLENAMYMNMKNDVAVLVSSWNLSFFEPQSTLNPNIPLRLLGYYTSKILQFISENELDIYGPDPVKLPYPRFHVLYNGKEKAPEKDELKLSDLYYNVGKKGEPMLELKVIQHNINGYKDGEGNCRQLYEYQWFVETFHQLKDRGSTLEEAAEEAINQMPGDFTIKELLMLNRDEVIDMWLFEYDEKKHMEIVQKNSETRGEVNRTMKLIQRKMDKGKSFEQACSDLDLTEDEIEEIKPSFEMMN